MCYSLLRLNLIDGTREASIVSNSNCNLEHPLLLPEHHTNITLLLNVMFKNHTIVTSKVELSLVQPTLTVFEKAQASLKNILQGHHLLVTGSPGCPGTSGCFQSKFKQTLELFQSVS